MKCIRKIGIILGYTLGILILLVVLIKFINPGITYTEIDLSVPEKQIDNATLLVLAYPEAICRTTEASYSNLLPLVGIGKKQLIRAGHACLVIAREGEEKLEYYDNGRYIAPEGFCRVRGENTDPELKIEIPAKWKGKKLINVEEILQWLYNHPEKTHGEGTLYAGIGEIANYEAAKECIHAIQSQEIIEYGPFARNATNCARFVTDVIYNSTLDPKLKKKIRNLYQFTPSGLSNIGAANSYNQYFKVDENGVQLTDRNLNLLQIEILFDHGEGYTDYSTSGTLCPPDNVPSQPDWQWLGGLGYGAWYEIKSMEDNHLFMVSCYTSKGQLNYSALYKSQSNLPSDSSFKITYPSHFERVTLIYKENIYTLEKIKNLYPVN